MFEPYNIGSVVFKKDWEFTPQCQEKVVDLCEKL